MDANDAGMRELAGAFRFALEVVERRGVEFDRIGQEFQRNGLVQLLVVRQQTTPMPPRPRIFCSV
jgi:hypothetical protein